MTSNDGPNIPGGTPVEFILHSYSVNGNEDMPPIHRPIVEISGHFLFDPVSLNGSCRSTLRRFGIHITRRSGNSDFKDHGHGFPEATVAENRNRLRHHNLTCF